LNSQKHRCFGIREGDRRVGTEFTECGKQSGRKVCSLKEFAADRIAGARFSMSECRVLLDAPEKTVISRDRDDIASNSELTLLRIR
jgi:hypothetical protein